MNTHTNTGYADFFITPHDNSRHFQLPSELPEAVKDCVATGGEKGKLDLHQIELRIRHIITNDEKLPPVKGRKYLDQIEQGFCTISDMTRNKVREKVVIRPFLDPRHHTPYQQQGQGLSATM